MKKQLEESRKEAELFLKRLQELSRKEAEKSLTQKTFKYVPFVKEDYKKKKSKVNGYTYMSTEHAARILTDNEKDAKDLLKLIKELKHFIF